MSEHEHGEQHERDSLSADLEAMRKIANALDSLHNDSARQRVLEWTQDRYHTTALQSAATKSVAAAPAARVAAKPRVGITSMIRYFAADLRRFALEW